MNNNSMVTKRTTCRLCESNQIQLVLPIKASPIADAFVDASKLSVEQPLFPLDLYQCQECGHVQNIDIVNPEALFRDYIFQTSSSAGLVKHFQDYAKDVVAKYNLKPGSLIVEIGSNDGTLLKFFKELGMRVVGIDPALEIANRANAEGIPTLPEFFTTALVDKIKSEFGEADLIVANNVYAHSDQLANMTDAIAHLLKADGVFVFEVSYLLDIVDRFLFDTVYHEHLSYHSIAPFKRFFAAHGLHFFDLEKIGTKGGSMRGFVQKAGASRVEQPVIEMMIQEENRRGLHKPEIFKHYEADILKRKNEVVAYIDAAIKKGQRVVAYGASTTAATLMYHFELEGKFEYLIDDNTKKHGLYSPGCHLEVKPGSVLYSDKPDVVVVLAWQYAAPICTKHEEYVRNGGIFIVPLTEMRVVTNDSMKLAV